MAKDYLYPAKGIDLVRPQCFHEFFQILVSFSVVGARGGKLKYDGGNAVLGQHRLHAVTVKAVHGKAAPFNQNDVLNPGEILRIQFLFRLQN